MNKDLKILKWLSLFIQGFNYFLGIYSFFIAYCHSPSYDTQTASNYPIPT